ncbi:MAG: hypothetical protein Q9227_001107 [Pyrenula ochraceoflavens]
MKFLVALAMGSLVMADHSLPPWHPPVEGEVRSPCPGLNALANHGIIPHDGKNLSHHIILSALPGSYRLNQNISEALFKMALETTLNPNATTFNLDDLNRHNFIEIDGSLSRGDAYFGDNHSFNQTIFNQTKSHWKDPVINFQNAGNAFAARVNTSKATNPEFSLTSERLLRGAGASGLFTVVFGEPGAGVVEKDRIVELFGESLGLS